MINIVLTDCFVAKKSDRKVFAEYLFSCLSIASRRSKWNDELVGAVRVFSTIFDGNFCTLDNNLLVYCRYSPGYCILLL